MPLFRIVKKGEQPGVAPNPGNLPPNPAQAPAYPQQQPMPAPQMPQPQQIQQFRQAPPQNMPPPQSYENSSKERIGEVAEAIIDEKWSELLKDINKIAEWKEKTDNRLAKVEEEINSLKENFESLHRGVLGKITEYDKNLTSVGTEIKAMEKE